jgi:hypothetical protein
MIGWSGILVQVGVAGGFVAFAFAAMGQLQEKRSGVNVLLVLVFTSIMVLLLARDLVHFSYLRGLHDLRPEAVEQISVCGEVLKSETEKAAVVGSLNSTQWFEPRRGGWRKTTTLSVWMKSGETSRYSVGLYRSGAVVLGKGDAFSSTLPAVLSTFGCSLPVDLNR